MLWVGGCGPRRAFVQGMRFEWLTADLGSRALQLVAKSPWFARYPIFDS